MNRALLLWLAAFCFSVFSFSVEAFKLTPEGSFIERKLASRDQNFWEKFLSDIALRGIHKIGESVHEEITNRVLGCEGDADICGAPEYDPDNAYILAGVRWNDDPPFRFKKNQGNFSGCEPEKTIRLVTFPRCWANVYKHGEKKAKKGKKLNADNATLLVRSHFGDLQFLHAMASSDGENATDVQARILTWSEFTWRTALGEFHLSMLVKDVPVVGIADFFGSSGWSIQDLFALGNPLVRKPENLSELAFGSLLHMVEDSFADGHVDRAMPDESVKCLGTANNHSMPGKIREFHSYVNQDSARHADGDTRSAFSANWSGPRPNVVDVGRTLYDYYVRRVSWDEVKPYIQCIFTLESDARFSSAGERFAR